MPKDDVKSIYYTGPSMRPILKPGDRLSVVPYQGEEVRRGDVIAFTPPGENAKVVHRVISVASHGIRTRGDNNDKADPFFLSPDRILGRVVFAQRRNRRRRVLRGTTGLALSCVVRAFNMIDSRLSSILRPVYYQASRHDLLRRWVPDWLAPRVVCFDRPGGTELQLLLGRHVIGRKLAGREQWYIRRPFRLLVDEASLSELSIVRRPLSVVRMQKKDDYRDG